MATGQAGVFFYRSSYPDRKEGEEEDEELPDEKTLEYDDETLELTLPSGEGARGQPEEELRPSVDVNASACLCLQVLKWAIAP